MFKNDQLSSKSHSLAYRPDIDGLRAVSVILVVGFHTFPEVFRGGYIGVDIFFVISGCLITSIIWLDLNFNKFNIINFYSKRIVRIFPALLAVLIFCLIFGWYLLLPNEYELLGRHIAAGSGFLSNIIYLNEVGYFDINSAMKPLLHLWSLGVEEQFYIFWPILLIIVWHRRWKWLLVIIFLVVGSFLLNIYYSFANPSFDFYSPLTRLWELLIGAFIGVWNQKNGGFLSFPRLERRIGVKFFENYQNFVISFFTLIGIFLMTLSVLYLTGDTRYPSWYALMPVLGAAFLLVLPKNSAGSKVLSHKGLVFLGKISYPLYLWHWPLLCFFRIVKGDQLGAGIKCIIIFASISLAYITYKLVEIPIQKNNQTGKTATLLLVAMTLVGSLGFYVAFEKGLINRPAIRDIVEMESALLSPQHFIKSDGSCDNTLQQPTLFPNVCIKNSNSPKIMIAGDSHAIALFGGIRNGKINESAVLYAGNGCLPLLNYVIQDNLVSRSWCLDYAANVLNTIDKMPSVEKVYLSTRGPVYFSGEGYGIEGKNKLSISRVNGNDNLSQEERFYLGYSSFIKQLIAKKIKVILITEIPELGEEPKNCIAKRPIFFFKKEASSCVQNKQDVLARKAKYFEIIERIKADNPDLDVYHGMNTFCDDISCYGKGSDGLWYWDDDHLSLVGSTKLLNDVLYKKSK